MTSELSPIQDSNLVKAPPALYGHCVNVYTEMLHNAKSIINTDGNTIIVWEGMLVQLITGKMYLSTPHYTSVTQALQRMGCVTQMKRGGGSGTSQWEMHYAPSLELFTKSQPKKVKKQDKYSAINELIDNLQNRIVELEKFHDAYIAMAIREQNTTKLTGEN